MLADSGFHDKDPKTRFIS